MQQLLSLMRLSLTIISVFIFSTAAAFATTKGLNQIVTPDVQPYGQLSISVQAQHPDIGNGLELQTELGVTKNFEIAIFQGIKPGALIFNAEYGIIQNGGTLLSAGVNNVRWGRGAVQPYLEAGYSRGKSRYMAGTAYSSSHLEGILGWGYQATPDLLLQLDYQSGAENYFTAGINVNISRNVQFNPAIYISNTASHTLLGYGVLTWNITAW